jgi:hypothetical protein
MRPKTIHRTASLCLSPVCPPSYSAIKLHLVVPEFVTSFGTSLAVVGSWQGWRTDKAALMTWAPGHSWTADIELHEDTTGSQVLEYKVGSHVRFHVKFVACVAPAPCSDLLTMHQ